MSMILMEERMRYNINFINLKLFILQTYQTFIIKLES